MLNRSLVETSLLVDTHGFGLPAQFVKAEQCLDFVGVELIFAVWYVHDSMLVRRNASSMLCDTRATERLRLADSLLVWSRPETDLRRQKVRGQGWPLASLRRDPELFR